MSRKLIESTFVSLDGVIADPQNWSSPYWDDQHATYAAKLIANVDALVLGRATYEGFAAAWPQRAGDPFADKLNEMPKYVASRTLREATWNATIVDGDVAERIAEIKRGPGLDLLKYGTGELDRTLIEHGLVDEFHFWMFPVIVGGGQRLLDDVATTHLKLVDTTRFDSGIVVLTYSPAT